MVEEEKGKGRRDGGEGGGGARCGWGSECIHAGQFMSTRVHEPSETGSDEEDAEIDVVTSDTESNLISRGEKPVEKPPSAKALKTSGDEKTVTFYKFGPKNRSSINIEVGLGKVNKFISFAYKRLTTPRWKYFHGLKLSWKDRLRLNNVIWRSWHMEFVARQRPKFCCYAVPIEETRHQQPEAAVVEGMYWKRRLDAVCAQYKRWRMAKTPHQPSGRTRSGRLRRHLSGSAKLRRSTDAPLDTISSDSKLVDSDIGALYVPRPSGSGSVSGRGTAAARSADTESILGAGGQLFDKDDLDNYFTDRLFDSLNQTSYMFPDSKDLQGGNSNRNADFIQPSLITLQPSLDEIMASLGEVDDPLFADSPFQTLDFRPAASKGKGKLMEETTASTAPPPAYTTKDYEDAQLLLPSPGDSYAHPTTAPPNVTYSQAISSMDPGISEGGMGMGPPHHPVTSQYPTPSKAAVKVYPSPPQHQDHPKVRAKRAKQRAREMEQESLNKPVQSIYPGSFAPMSTMSGVASAALTSTSAFTPVLQQHSPYRTPVLSPVSPPQPHRLQPVPTLPHHPMPTPHSSFLGFVNHHHPPPAPPPASSHPASIQSSHSSPLLLAKPSQPSPFPPASAYPFNHHHAQLSPLPSPSSAASSSNQSASPVTSPHHNHHAHILSNGPIKKEPMERASPRTVKEEGRTGRRGNKAGTKRAAADSTMDPQERKRMLHLHAEQSRRSALKSGFDQLEEMLPNISPGSKNTNAAILARASDHIRDLRARVSSDKSELARVSSAVSGMQERIRLLQTEMPTASGSATASLPALAATALRARIKRDWKTALLWRLCAKLWRSFVQEVDGLSSQELLASAQDWAARHCNVVELRPEMSAMLVELATESPNVLREPASLPTAVIDMASKIHP